MFNKRWKKIVAWSLSVVLVIVIGGLFAANYAVDKLMTSMAEGLDEEPDSTSNSQNVLVEPSVAPSESTSAMTDNEVSNSKDGIEIFTPSVPSVSNEETQSVISQNASEKSGSEVTPTVTIQPTSVPSSNKIPETGEYSAQISADKAKQIQENVTVKEKADVASIVMGQLSVSDIKRLQELASGGLTIDEKREARSIILGKVSEEQYNELSQIAKKYGVSEGKTQAQVIAEEEASTGGSEQ